MLKQDLVIKSPVSRTIGIENVTDSRFGAVLSRAGIGKTGFLVQIALTQMLADKKVLHISLDDDIEKINIRYDEAYQNLIDYIGYVDPAKASELWDEINVLKVGIRYTEETFDTEKISDYLKSFADADMALPSIIILDGVNFDQDVSGILEQLEQIHATYKVPVWFSMQSHREEPLSDDGFPIQLEKYKNRFDKALLLQPVNDLIEAVILKDGDRTDQKSLLNPGNLTMAAS